MKSQDPFLHPAVGKVLKAVWYEGSSQKPALASRFGNRCSVVGYKGKVVPEAMVTIAATVVRQTVHLLSSRLCYYQIEAALIDCSNRTADKVSHEDFSAGTFEEVHNWHCDLLGGICARNKRLHHRILSSIHNAVT